MTGAGQNYWAREWTRAAEDDWGVDSLTASKGRRLRFATHYTISEAVPGLVAAEVYHQNRLHRCSVGIRPLSNEEWNELINIVAADRSTTVDLLVGQLPVCSAVAERLLPQSHEIHLDCTCGQWNGGCVHVAGLLFHTADLIEADPFVLSTLRGLGRYDLQARLEHQTCSTEQAGVDLSFHGARGVDPGIPASAAFRASPQSCPPQLSLPLTDSNPDRPTVSPPPPIDSGVTAEHLDQMIAAAAAYAHAQLDPHF